MIAVVFVGFGVAGAMIADGMMEGAASVTPESHVQDQAFLPPETGIARTIDPTKPLPAWLKNAAQYSGSTTQPRLAVVVVDDGTDAGSTLKALRLDHPVTLAVSPTVDGARARADAARRLNREVLLLLPMESGSGFDTTPNPIVSHVGRDELQRRLSWNLAQLDGYVGVTNRFGETTTRDAKVMRTVMETLFDKGLLYVDARAHPDSIAGAVARRLGVVSGDSSVSVKPGADTATVRARLDEAVSHARNWGYAIILIPAERDSVNALKAWFEVSKSDVAFTPVTAVIRRLRSGT